MTCAYARVERVTPPSPAQVSAMRGPRQVSERSPAIANCAQEAQREPRPCAGAFVCGSHDVTDDHDNERHEARELDGKERKPHSDERIGLYMRHVDRRLTDAGD